MLQQSIPSASTAKISRRAFLGGTGALVVALVSKSLAGRPAFAAAVAESSDIIAPSGISMASVDTWLVVHPNNRVTVYSGKIDSGTGVRTALAQIVAEDLDVPFASIDMVMGITGVVADQGITDASVTIQYGAQPMRAAAAKARQKLVELGARHLSLPIDGVESLDGHIFNKQDRTQHVSYGELIGDQRFDLSITIEEVPNFLSFSRQAKTDAPLKDPKDYKIVGTSIPRVDIPPKVTGETYYVHDLRMPGMLHARILRPRVDSAATLVKLDEGAIAGMNGIVKLVRNGNFVGVIAQRQFQAIQAIDKLRQSAQWDLPETPSNENLYDHLVGLPAAASESSAGIGNPNAVPADAVKSIKAQYRNPYQSHGSIGPSCAVALFDGKKMKIWAATQSPYPLRAAITEITGLGLSDVQIIYREGAGCYGQNGQDDVAGDAALLAMAHPNAPIRVQWMRQDEFAAEAKYPAMIMDTEGAVDKDGRMVLLNYAYKSGPHLARRANGKPGQDGRTSLIGGWYKDNALKPFWANGAAFSRTHSLDTDLNPLYDVPNSIFKGTYYESPIRSGELRGVGDFSVFFAVESLVDELSVAAGIDPVQFRLNHMKEGSRRYEIVARAAKLADWQPHVSGAKRDGHGRGVALAFHGSYICTIVDVDVDLESGAISIPRIYATVDVGLVITPDGLKNQIEGGIIQAASRSLLEEVIVENNEIRSLDWSTYPIFKFTEIPEIVVELVNRPEVPPAGAGELGSCPITGAIANAIFDATGARLRDLPFTPERIKSAMQAG